MYVMWSSTPTDIIYDKTTINIAKRIKAAGDVPREKIFLFNSQKQYKSYMCHPLYLYCLDIF